MGVTTYKDLQTLQVGLPPSPPQLLNIYQPPTTRCGCGLTNSPDDSGSDQVSERPSGRSRSYKGRGSWRPLGQTQGHLAPWSCRGLVAALSLQIRQVGPGVHLLSRVAAGTGASGPSAPDSSVSATEEQDQCSSNHVSGREFGSPKP